MKLVKKLDKKVGKIKPIKTKAKVKKISNYKLKKTKL